MRHMAQGWRAGFNGDGRAAVRGNETRRKLVPIAYGELFISGEDRTESARREKGPRAAHEFPGQWHSRYAPL